MPVAVVFAFAVADGLPPVVGAAPYDVLARQLPRLLVARLNGGGDRGVRFFPYLGPVDGRRDFLRLPQPLEPAVLQGLHRQGDVAVLADGWFAAGRLHWRLLDGERGRVLLDGETAFDPRRPFDALARLEFELAGQLGFTGRPQPWPPLQGEALGWFLVLKDQLLRREANLPDAADPLRAAGRCVALAAADAGVQELVADYAAQLLRVGAARDGLAPLLAELAAVPDLPAERLERLAALLQACGDDGDAATAALRQALLQPQRAEVVERAAALLYRQQRFADVEQAVGAARACGAASPAALAQLAAVRDRLGDRAGRRELTDELLGRADLPVPVVRLLVSFLLEEGRAQPARDLAERTLARDAASPLLWFELGRACLLLDDGPAAQAALQRALQGPLPPAVLPQAQRFLRLAALPGLWAGTQAVERALAHGDLAAALAAARRLVRGSRGAAEAWFLLGVVRHKLGQTRRAERALRAAIAADAGCADAHNRLGVLLLGRGDLAGGQQLLERAVQLAPGEASPLLHLAQACALRGDHAAAERHLHAAALAGAEPALLEAVRREVAAARA